MSHPVNSFDRKVQIKQSLEVVTDHSVAFAMPQRRPASVHTKMKYKPYRHRGPCCSSCSVLVSRQAGGEVQTAAKEC